MAGTFNGNPLTMAASQATLLEVLVPDAYEQFNRIDKAMKDGLTSVIETTGLPAYVSGVGAKGSVIYSTRAGARVPRRGRHRRAHQLPRVARSSRTAACSSRPWTKQETWTLSVWHTEDDAARYVANFEEFATAVTA